MAGETVSQKLNPLAIVQGWAQKPGTVSNKIVTGEISAELGKSTKASQRQGPSSRQRLMDHAAKLPADQAAALLEKAKQVRTERESGKQRVATFRI